MLWAAVALLSAASLSAAQDNCACVPYYYCNDTQSAKPTESSDTGSVITWKEEEEDEECTSCKCESHMDLCCYVGPGNKQPIGKKSTVCGVRGKINNKNLEPDTKVPQVDWKVSDLEGDTETSFGEFPWMVAIMDVSSGAQEFLCGGSIISPYVVLTAAHTLKNLSPSQLSVKAGVWNTTDLSETILHQDRPVDRVVLHSGFDKAKVSNDFALLFLHEPFTVNDNVAPVCLPDSNTPVNKSNCIATGWGEDNYGNAQTYQQGKTNINSVLRKVDLPIVEFTKCQDQLRKEPRLGSRFNLHPSFICAGSETADTCKGDGGGPLMCPMLKDLNSFVQVGITSWGLGCNNGMPGAYSSVEAAIDWIETQIDTNLNSLRGV